MDLHLICAGTPTPTPSRFGSCYVLGIGEDFLMFDCGPAATYKVVQHGLDLTQIGYLFLTHHHYDHVIDYPCFLLTRWNHHTGQEVPLGVWGPPGTVSMTESLIGPEGVFARDWLARVHHPASQSVHVERGGTLPRPGPSFDVHDADPGPLVQGRDWMVSAGEGQHADPWLRSRAYRVDTEGHSIVFTGDAVPTETLTGFAQGVDTLVVNCWDHQDAMLMDMGISGTRDAGRLAAQTGAGRLILTHSVDSLCRPGGRERGVVDIARLFAGEIIFGDEGMTITL